MADKYLNKTDFSYFWNRLKSYFVDKTTFEALDDKVDEIIAEGGEPNVVETVKRNGTALVPDANKAVDVSVPTTVAELSDASDYALAADVPTATSDLTNDGDGTSNFATEAYVDTNGGKIDKIKVNNTEEQIDPTDKSVNITVPTAVSDLTNDSNFQTDTDVDDAIAAAIADVTQFDFEIVQSLPASGEKGVIYLISNSGSTPNIYDEYIWVTSGQSGSFEKIGTTDIDLTQYWSKAELTAITTAEIDEIMDGTSAGS